MPRVLTDGEVIERYGRFDWSPNGDSMITIRGDWAANNIVTVYIPQLDGVESYGSAFSGRVRWHRLGVEQLQRAWAEVEREGFTGDVRQWGGSFVPRRKRGGNTLSHHSWGIAFDINVPWNGFRQEPARAGRAGSVRRLVPIFERHGFVWGGSWSPNYRDGMHFELAEPPNYRQVDWQPNARLAIQGVRAQIDVILREGVAYASLNAMAQAVGDNGVSIDRNTPVGQYLRTRGYDVSWDAANRLVVARRA